MIRSAAMLRQSLAAPVPGTLYSSRHGKALTLRWALSLSQDWMDRNKAWNCRSVREQQQHENQETDGLPAWL